MDLVSKPGCFLGLIPARGGSKQVPRKNVAPVGGKPLLAWTVEAALASGVLDRVIVSTEDREISAVAAEYGAEVPFVRPEALAQDDTPSADVACHALEWLRAHENFAPEYIVLLQPTSPLRRAEDIRAAIAMALERHADAVVSVTAARQHPYWTQTITADGLLAPFVSKMTTVRRQDLPPAYALNGAIFVTRAEVILREHSFFAAQTYPYVMPAEYSLDIDDELELAQADMALRKRAGEQLRVSVPAAQATT